MVQLLGSQCFVLQVTSDGCTSLPDTVCLTVVPAYVAQLPADTVICQGDSVLLRASVSLPGSGLVWSTVAGPITGNSSDSLWVNPSQTTQYQVMPGSLAGCPGVGDSLTVNVELPAVHALPSDIEFCPGEPLRMGVDPEMNFVYSWSPWQGLSDPFASQTLVYSLESQVYTLLATDTTKLTAHCRSLSMPVNLQMGDCFFPNVLTPNGDGINDVLDLGLHFNRVSIVVLDRWGAQVYAQDGYQNDWDGRNANGQALPEGVYYYRVKGTWTGFAQSVGSPLRYDAVHVLTLMR
jgi:gliding motility-associated-like protein